MDDPSSPAGIEVDAVTSWLRDRIAWLTPPLRWSKLAGGHSNFTYRVTDETGREFVLRRPPLGELLPSAHDMAREFRMISALWPTPVPVPEPLALCEDKAVTGAVFYAMGIVEGKGLYDMAEAVEHVPEALRREHGFHFIDVLADLHSLDPEAVGLGGLGRPDAYVARQLRRWKGSWDASKTEDLPSVDRLHDLLASRIPEQKGASIVHGDYTLNNVVSSRAGRVTAVVDWEISTLGDSLADLAYSLNQWGKRGEVSKRGVKASFAPGYPTDDELLERYASRRPVELTHIDYYRAFNHWRTTCIVDGVLARYLNGQKSTEGVDLAGLRAGRDEAIEKALGLADRL